MLLAIQTKHDQTIFLLLVGRDRDRLYGEMQVSVRQE